MAKKTMLRARQWSALLLAAVSATFFLGAGASANAATASHAGGKVAIVHLKIVGTSGTIFSGLVATRAHDVTTAAGGTHKCDGTNNNKNPEAGPTVTGAIDDAAKRKGFTWDGPWYPSFEDYFITRIAGDSNTDTVYWQYWLNGEYAQLGGCQQRVLTGDKIVWKLVPPANP